MVKFNNDYFIKYLIVGCLFLTFLILIPFKTHSSYTVSPIIVDIELEPREMTNQVLTINNNLDRLLRVYASVNTVTLDDGGEIQDFVQRSQADNTVTPTSWFSVSRGRIEIPAGSVYELPVKIQVHPQAKPGIYHVFVGVGQGSNRDQAEDSVRNNIAQGTVYRIHIADDRTAYLRLRDFTSDRMVSNVLSSNFTFNVDNPSDTPLTPRGEMIIYDSRGREVFSYHVNKDMIEILPGDSMNFTVPMHENVAWGRNRALLNLTYGDGQRAMLSDTIFFYRIPLNLLLVLFALLLILSVFVAYVIHRKYVMVKVEIHDDADTVPVLRRQQVTRQQSETDVNIKNIHENNVSE